MNKEEVKRAVLIKMQSKLTDAQLEFLDETLREILYSSDLDERKSNEDLLQDFLAHKTFLGCSPASISQYANECRLFFNFTNKDVRDVTKHDVEYYLATYKRTHNVVERTINTKRAYLSTFFEYLFKEDVVFTNCVQKTSRVKEPSVIKEPFTEAQLESIKDHAHCLRDRAIIETLDTTGLRVHELVKLNKSDVLASYVLVRGKGKKDRKVFIGKKAMYWINKYLDTRTDSSDALFVSLRDRNGRRPRVSKEGVETMCRQLGSELHINCHPHKFRHTFCTRLLSRGVGIDKVMYLMGHSSADTTMIYRHISEDEIAKDLAIFN